MRVLHIDTEMTWRGGQNQTRLLIEGLLNQSFDVYLAAPRDSAMAHAMQGRIPVLELDLRSGFDWRAGKQIGKFCRSELIDLMDAQSGKAHNLALIAKRYAKDTRLIIHRRVDYRPSGHIFNKLKYCTKKVDRYVAISDAIGRILVDFGVKPERVKVVKSAASPMSFNYESKEAAKRAYAARLSLSIGKVWIGNASALSEQKDYPTLLRAFSRLKKIQLPFLGLIAGTGNQEASLKKLAKELGLTSDELIFLGFRDDVPDFLQALDIFALSSQDEGLGTVILDAYQAGCCVAATEVGGIPEIVEHARSGLLAPRFDDDMFAQNLQRLMENESLRKLYADTGQRKVSKEFSVGQMIKGNIDVYRDVMLKG